MGYGAALACERLFSSGGGTAGNALSPEKIRVSVKKRLHAFLTVIRIVVIGILCTYAQAKRLLVNSLRVAG